MAAGRRNRFRVLVRHEVCVIGELNGLTIFSLQLLQEQRRLLSPQFICESFEAAAEAHQGRF